jgi:hypothetical protein
MSELDDFLSTIPLDQLANQLGLSEDEAGTAVRQAAPALLAGMQANAADPGGAAALEVAVGQHDPSLLDHLDLGALNTDDGAKIVRHVFGADEEQVVNQLSGANGLSSGTLMKLLPMLAPLVMAFLSKQVKGGGAAQGAGEGGLGGMLGGGGGLGDILGGLLGGGGSGGGGGLGDILGGLLGGGTK